MFPTSYSEKTGLSYGAGLEGCSKVETRSGQVGRQGRLEWRPDH